jgi:hypothetical protein
MFLFFFCLEIGKQKNACSFMRVSLFKILTSILFLPLISGGYNEIEKHQRKKENGCKSLDQKKKSP